MNRLKKYYAGCAHSSREVVLSPVYWSIQVFCCSITTDLLVLLDSALLNILSTASVPYDALVLLLVCSRDLYLRRCPHCADFCHIRSSAAPQSPTRWLIDLDHAHVWSCTAFAIAAITLRAGQFEHFFRTASWPLRFLESLFMSPSNSRYLYISVATYMNTNSLDVSMEFAILGSKFSI